MEKNKKVGRAEEIDEGLVKRLNDILAYKNMSGNALANAIGYNYTTSQNYVNGIKAPRVEYLKKVLSLFKEISAEWLLLGEGDMFKGDNETINNLKKEIADLKIKLLVAEGVTKEIKDIIREKMHNEIKKESRVG